MFYFYYFLMPYITETLFRLKKMGKLVQSKKLNASFNQKIVRQLPIVLSLPIDSYETLNQILCSVAMVFSSQFPGIISTSSSLGSTLFFLHELCLQYMYFTLITSDLLGLRCNINMYKSIFPLTIQLKLFDFLKFLIEYFCTDF